MWVVTGASHSPRTAPLYTAQVDLPSQGLDIELRKMRYFDDLLL